MWLSLESKQKSSFDKDLFMKKIISIGLTGMLICGAVTAQSVKIVNTFGGDADNTGGSDLFTFENQKNEEEEGYSNEFKNTTQVSNRLQ